MKVNDFGRIFDAGTNRTYAVVITDVRIHTVVVRFIGLDGKGLWGTAPRILPKSEIREF